MRPFLQSWNPKAHFPKLFGAVTLIGSDVELFVVFVHAPCLNASELHSGLVR